MNYRAVFLLFMLFCGQNYSLSGQDSIVDTSFLGNTMLLFAAAPRENISDKGYLYSISLLRADGIEVIIDSEESSNTCGDISPDGERIVFDSTRDLNGESGGLFHSEIYVANIDGSGERRLTFNAEHEIEPRWSPDGKRIVFMGSNNEDELSQYEIYLMDADGDNFQQLTDNDSADRFPSWSPDGERILFHSDRDGDYELYTMTLDGENVEQFTDNGWEDARAMFSPDGTVIVFNSNRYDLESLFRMRADGNKIERLPTGEGLAFGGVWSPDGTMIAFMHTREDEDAMTEIWVMNADGSDARPVLADPAVDYVICDWDVSNDQ
jgi:Tol biopolymer transport system component